MKHKVLLGLFVVAVTVVFASPAFSAAGAKTSVAKEKVAFQISEADPKKLYIALGAASNAQKTYGKKNAVIEVVAFGPGVNLFTLESEAGQRIDAALKDGIKILICENTLKSQNMSEADLLPGLSYVPAGILHLIRRQKEGYSYILP